MKSTVLAILAIISLIFAICGTIGYGIVCLYIVLGFWGHLGVICLGVWLATPTKNELEQKDEIREESLNEKIKRSRNAEISTLPVN